MYEELVEPARVFFSEKTSKIPMIDSASVANMYGTDTLRKISSLKDVFFGSNAFEYFAKDQDWVETEKRAKSDFLKLHPECCSELVELFWWSYSYCLWKDGVV